MTEKTAEEKLREELEGKLSGNPHEKEAGKSETVRKPVKPRTTRSRTAARKTEKPVNIGQRVDSFMEDFERRIAESLNAEKVLGVQRSESERIAAEGSSAELGVMSAAGSSEPAKKSAGKIVRRRRKTTEKTELSPKPEKAESDILGLAAIAGTPAPETSQPIPESEPAPETSHPAPESEPAPEISQPVHESELAPETSQPVPESEPAPEIPQPAPEPDTAPESSQPVPEAEAAPETSQHAPESEPAPDFDDDTSDYIPVEIVNESDEEIDDEFPDIPVIDAQELAESSDSPEENTFPDIPVISPDSEVPDDSFTPSENTTDFPPFADVVVNVDDVLPQIPSENQQTPSDEYPSEDLDSESQAAPVTVTMPETTKTAVDKLMANIAEAMIGNPLSLDSIDQSEPYRLPENLLNPQNDPNFLPKSAQDKLIADISQAISESPIETAQNQAHQSFEDDISPFDEMPIPEPIQTPDFDESYEQEEGDDFDEPFLPDFSGTAEQQEQSQEEALDQEEPLDEDNTDEFSDPFSFAEDEASDDEDISDSDDTQDSAEDTEDFPDMPGFSLLDEPENNTDTDNIEPVTLEKTPEPEPQPQPELDTPPEPEPDPETVPDPEPETQSLTAEERLAQELADFTNQDSTSDLLGISAPDTDSEPEVSLLDEPDPQPETEPEQTQQPPQSSDDDLGEDFNFMDSWGDAASTMNYGDDEPDPQEHEPPSQEIPPQPVMPSVPEFEPAAKIMHTSAKIPVPESPEDSEPEPQTSPLLRTILQAVLGLLLLAGIFSLFRLQQLNDTITGMMLFGNSQPVTSAQSYDYAVDRVPDGDVSSRMRLRGIEGWKLVGSRRTQNPETGRYGYEFIFMRPTPDNL
ncbi:MAG: hypothetical protein IJS39_05360 [Synergistaceae bacterium]|nr:hypothetical protein [Synergistaceae bacterium]